jgi:hypothetical protein
MPNIQIAMTLGVKVNDKFREHAESIVKRSKLPQERYTDFVNAFALFLASYSGFIQEVSKPHGTGASFSVDSIEGRETWRKFLVNGRILIDFIGRHTCAALNLKQPLGKTFNLDSIDSLIKILGNEGRKRPELLLIKDKLLQIRPSLKTFIDLRNLEKFSGDTIVEFPAVHEKGITKDGVVRTQEATYPMVHTAESAYKAICLLVDLLLGIS